jgi:hypothetical protein
MTSSQRNSLCLLLAGIVALLTACVSGKPATPPPATFQGNLANTSTTEPAINDPQQFTPVSSPTLSATSTHTPVSTPQRTSTVTVLPTQLPTATATITPTLTIGSLLRGVYSSGGCTEYSVVQKHPSYGAIWAGFSWCVVSVEINKDGSMTLMVSWELTDFSEVITKVTKRGDLNNPNMYLTDNLNNQYAVIKVTGDGGAGDLTMEKGITYFCEFLFRPPKPGANTFSFHDDDNKSVISGIVLDKPSIFINDVLLKWTPASITYYSDKWTASQTEQGGFKLTHTKYANCVISESQPGEPQGALINTIDIGALKYDIYRTQMDKWSLREYVLVGGLDEAVLATKPMLQVTIPYENSAECLDAVGTVLASLHIPAP